MPKARLNNPDHKRVALFNRRGPLFGSWFLMKIPNGLPAKVRDRNLRFVYAAVAKFKPKHKPNSVLVLVLVCDYIRPVAGARRRFFGKKEFRTPCMLTNSRQHKRTVW
jgi:hypothetical protein